MNTLRTLAMLAAALLLSLPLRAEPAAEDILGVWLTEGGASRIHVHVCAEDSQELCGSIVWTRDGHAVGKRILSGFAFDGEIWQGGRIADPRDGSSYRSRLSLLDADALEVKGCWLLFCGGQTWRRAAMDTVELAVPAADEDS